MNKKIQVFRLAFSHTFPILTGIVFIGLSYGMYMNKLGFSFLYPMFMAMFIFAGSMEFIAASLLLQNFNPINALIMTLIINARHLFYGISMLDNYKNVGLKKFFLIFAMCDETFIINFSAKLEKDLDKPLFMMFVNLQIYSYWVISSALGGILANYIHFNTTGIDFVMTALFVVIFIEQWNSQKEYIPMLIGLGASIFSLALFGPKNFIIFAMLIILLILTIFKNRFKDREQKEVLA